jgi:tetratricopeptide (TPR) repeat protein
MIYRAFWVSLAITMNVSVVGVPPVFAGAPAAERMRLPSGTAIEYINAADKKEKQGDFRGALADYNRAIALDSRSATAYNNRGILKETKFNDTPGALADYNQAIAIEPATAVFYYNRGDLKEKKLRDIEGALADYSKAIETDPQYALAYNNRANLKANQLNDVPDFSC